MENNKTIHILKYNNRKLYGKTIGGFINAKQLLKRKLSGETVSVVRYSDRMSVTDEVMMRAVVELLLDPKTPGSHLWSVTEILVNYIKDNQDVLPIDT